MSTSDPVGTGDPVGTIDRVGVVGCGTVGAGFADLCARTGLDVVVVGSGPDSVARGRRRLLAALDSAVRQGRVGPADRDAALSRVSFTADLADLGDRELVLEAVPEHEPTKAAVFAGLDKAVRDPDAILASTTSAIPIMRLARASDRSGHVVGLHFFNPVPVMPLVELTGSLHTEDRVRARAEDFVTGVLGKQVIRGGDRAGFVVNALLVPYLLAAVRMVESGFASAEDIDRGMRLGCAHPMGPLALTDLIGLDVVAAVAEALYEEFKEPLYAPPPLLLRMVEGGLLGRKAGRGFHDHR